MKHTGPPYQGSDYAVKRNDVVWYIESSMPKEMSIMPGQAKRGGV
jgi:hypothetical protein